MHRMTKNHCFIFQYMLNCYQFLYYVEVQTEETYAHAHSQQLCINDSSPPTDDQNHAVKLPPTAQQR